MDSSVLTSRRPGIEEILEDLITAAESRRGWMPSESLERQFYLGVEAAAKDVLDPARVTGRSASWLARETDAFRDGYERTRVLVTSVFATGRSPRAMLLPEYKPTALD
jgi:hypothetical protein